jgi:DNA-directed RNA polymerase subunit RPC12/RpoP
MNKIIGATVATVAIAGLMVWTYLEYTGTEYICNKCGQQYTPQPVQWSVGMHLPTRRHMKCPHCGDWGRHKRVRVPDNRDFI